MEITWCEVGTVWGGPELPTVRRNVSLVSETILYLDLTDVNGYETTYR
jgi:hypothetical protein